MKTSTTARRSKSAHNHEADYSALLASVRTTFDTITNLQKALFITDATGLFDLYLDNLPIAERQHHNCHACQKFVNTFGGLVLINEDGSMLPVMWNQENAPDLYMKAFGEMRSRVKKARVVSPFWSKFSTWGTPVTGDWTHFAVTPNECFLHRDKLLTAGQRMAAAKESFKTVALALSEVKPVVLDEVLRLFESETLVRSDKFIGPVKWLRELQDRPRGRAGENMLWKAIATAPEGFLHPRASIVWPLVEAVIGGEDFASVKSKFDAMTAPLRYQRPQVAPSIGNVKQAEEIVAKLGIAPSLERRFARLEDAKDILWSPVPLANDIKEGTGVFGHLKTKEDVKNSVPRLDLPAVTITLEKFMRTVLPTAEQMTLNVPLYGRFTAFTTAMNDDAPPIIKWDMEDARNPVAWYTYPSGSMASQWGLQGHSEVAVTAIVPFPTNATMPFATQGFLLALEGCVDSNVGSGNALFPEYLKQDLFSIRSTIEAYSRSKELAGRAEANVCGWDMRKDDCTASLKVFCSGRWTDYRIDRWD